MDLGIEDPAGSMYSTVKDLSEIIILMLSNKKKDDANK